MKRRLRRYACFAALLFIPMSAFAVSGWTDYVSIAELIPTNSGRFLVKLNNSKNPSGCKNESMFYQDYSASGSEQMFRVILEAVASGKMIRVYVTGKCEINGYSEISSVGIVP
jgi:hypothetical protein